MKGSAWAADGRLAVAAALALCAGAVAGEAADGASNRNPQTMNTSNTQKPDAVSRLETAYGGPSQAGFGSAVFHETLRGEDDLTQAALSTYRTFVGPLWERYGERAWMR